MFTRLRRSALVFSVTVLSILSAEGLSSAYAGDLDDVARHLYQVHAENFYCPQALTPWDEVVGGDTAEAPPVILYQALIRVHDIRQLRVSPLLAVNRYQRDTFYERELINAP